MKDKTPEQLEAIEKETRGFVCPNCGEHWQFRLSIKVNGIQPTLTGAECDQRDGRVPVAPPTPTNGERPALQRLLQYYQESGVLSAFEQVVQEVKAHQLPKSIGSFFLSWLQKCSKVQMIPKMALRKLINEFDDGQIEVWHSDEIAAVISDGKLRAFVPIHILRGELVRLGKMSNTRLRTRATDEQLDVWIKTRNGYVLNNSLLFGELKQKAAGQFEVTVR